MELEEFITILEGNLKSLQSELRHVEDEAAELHKRREGIINNLHHAKKKRREMENLVVQRKKKLESLEREDDLDTAKKLVDSAEKLNIERYRIAVELKNLLIEAVAYRRSFSEKNMASIELEAKNLLIEAVAYRRSFSEKNMASIELEAKVKTRPHMIRTSA
ncbi:unnamed protein product [Ilex paraguariensis]|uniref:Uncharacterized protein n=1 Tax=Ilex paraguariensis TaxID=185542 RepID=A0ABC8S645_9AQUA